MGKKFNKPSPAQTNKSKINFPDYNKEIAHSELVRFSFKYLNKENKSYSVDNKDSSYFLKFIERISLISAMTVSALKYPTVKALRNHFIDWNDTSQSSFGLPNEEQLVEKPFQFGISANEHGRVIGFFILNTFYIVWFDPDHNTYT